MGRISVAASQPTARPSQSCSRGLVDAWACGDRLGRRERNEAGWVGAYVPGRCRSNSRTRLRGMGRFLPLDAR